MNGIPVYKEIQLIHSSAFILILLFVPLQTQPPIFTMRQNISEFPRCFTPLFDSLALFVKTSVNSAGLERNGENRQFEIGQCNDSGKKRRSLRKTKPSGETLKFILFFGHSLTAYSARSARDSTQEYPILYFPFNIPNAAPSCHRI